MRKKCNYTKQFYNNTIYTINIFNIGWQIQIRISLQFVDEISQNHPISNKILFKQPFVIKNHQKRISDL